MLQQLANLSKFGQAYVLGVSILGLAVAGQSLVQLLVHEVDPQWLILAALTLLTGAFTVRIPGIPAHLSVSDTFVLVSIFLFGPAAGTIIALLDALIISFRVIGKTARQPFRIIFNGSAVALSSNVAGQIFYWVSGIRPYSVEPTPLSQILLPLFLCSLTYFLLNSWLVTLALAFEKRRPPFNIWRDNFLWLSVNYFVGGSVAGLLVTYSRDIDLTTLGIIVPLLFISYLTFKTSLGRIEDANQHLTRVNKMYLSTIETLAMAIDAKDQITHGHIRRVQRLAVGLARVVGVNDETQIKAIEAAALLHDMGKLAIPEFILNKPGKLTGNEFDVMKQHANIGADILGSIQFPYPVVPIVRHHHEAWDGSGYPDGLKGVEIPLGARVLSVVDCFDALTSDRPYRPALSTEQAISVLVERRGTMYDPLIVDKFIEAQEELSATAASSESDKEAMETIATKLRVAAEPVTASAGKNSEGMPLKALALLKSILPSPAGIAIGDLGLIVSRQLSLFTRFSGLALYCVTDKQHSLECRYADGSVEAVCNGTEIQLGEKLSGWVAAHRTPIWNSDATLDLASEFAKAAGVSLGSSVPLIDGENLIGALTIYSPKGQEVGIEQRMLIQAIAPSLASAFAASLEHNKFSSIDGTAKEHRETLYAVLDGLLSHDRTGHLKPDFSVLLLVTWPHANEQSEWRQAILKRELAAVAGDKVHGIILSESQLLIAGTVGILSSMGLWPVFSAKAGTEEYRVSEISNSLQLREALGLTFPNDMPQSGKPLVH